MIVGQRDPYEEAFSDAKPAIHFHIETFGEDVINLGPLVLEVFVAEAGV